MSEPTFAGRTKLHAEATEAVLAARLSEPGAAPERLVRAMAHAALGGGKRIRPFLLAETACLFGAEPAATYAAAAALEAIHCYSLVHDDLPAMDNDRLRRGQPTVWVAFDEWTAILAGDGLLTLAFEILADPSVPIPPDRRIALVGKLAEASGWQGMVGGQAIDLAADKLGEPAHPDESHVRRLQAMKTGALILYACEAGAILGGADPDARADLVAFGRALGLAFQIADDLLDAEGDAATMGKAAGKDAAAGKATLVSILGVAAARAELERTHKQAIASLERFGARAGMLRACADFIVARDH